MLSSGKRERKQAKPLGLLGTPNGAEGGEGGGRGREGKRQRRAPSYLGATGDEEEAPQSGRRADRKGKGRAVVLDSEDEGSPELGEVGFGAAFGASASFEGGLSTFAYGDPAAASSSSSPAFGQPPHPNGGGLFPLQQHPPPPSKPARPKPPRKRAPRPSAAQLDSDSHASSSEKPWLAPRAPPSDSSGDERDAPLDPSAPPEDPYGGLLTPSEAASDGRVPGQAERERWRVSKAVWEEKERGVAEGRREGERKIVEEEEKKREEEKRVKEEKKRERERAREAKKAADKAADKAAEGAMVVDGGSAGAGVETAPSPGGAGDDADVVVVQPGEALVALDKPAEKEKGAEKEKEKRLRLPPASLSTSIPSPFAPFSSVSAGALTLASGTLVVPPPASNPTSIATGTGTSSSLPILPITHLIFGLPRPVPPSSSSLSSSAAAGGGGAGGGQEGEDDAPLEIKTWYQAPFPDEFTRVASGKLWVCEGCLKYCRSGFEGGRHRVHFLSPFLSSLPYPLVFRKGADADKGLWHVQLKCKMRHPPGDEIYRDGKVSVFEVDGRKNKVRSLSSFCAPLPLVVVASEAMTGLSSSEKQNGN